jgi:hypothetical protein
MAEELELDPKSTIPELAQALLNRHADASTPRSEFQLYSGGDGNFLVPRNVRDAADFIEWAKEQAGVTKPKAAESPNKAGISSAETSEAALETELRQMAPSFHESPSASIEHLSAAFLTMRNHSIGLPASDPQSGGDPDGLISRKVDKKAFLAWVTKKAGKQK